MPTLPAVTNLVQLLSRQASTRPDAVALVQPGSPRRSLTWRELDERVMAVASGLAAHGLVAGHRVALRGPNSIEFVVAYCAILRAGYVCVPINPEASPDEVRTMLLDSGARLVVGSVDAQLGVPGIALTESGLAGLGGEARPVTSPQDPEALALLLYTAGTSGDPKAAMLTHRALLSHLHHVEPFGIVDGDTVVLAVLPLFHVFGLNAVLGSCLMSGASLVILDGPDSMLEVVVEERVTNLPVSPALVYAMLQRDDLATILAQVRTVVSGAAPLSPALADEFATRTGLRLEQGYGLTEASPGVTVTFGGKMAGPGLVGRALPGVDIRIGDGSEEGEPAEIWVRGENLFSGYWPDGEGGPEADGWFATGDIGYLDDGELYLVDRTGELIIVNGFNVYPAEVEAVIREVPGVEAAAVIGRVDDHGGEQVVAFVAGSGLTEAMVADHCAARLARFKRPAEVQVLEELPRGATGKVKKGLLRQMASRT